VEASSNRVDLIEDIFTALPKLAEYHSVSNPLYCHFEKIIEDHFQGLDTDRPGFGPFADLYWPRVPAGDGTVDSYAFFCAVEMIIYAFYWRNRDRYRTLFDVGSNMGADAIIAAKMGYKVDAFEPDPRTFEMLNENIAANNAGSVVPHMLAILDTTGTAQFVRVKGNIMANHIAGVREFYGAHDAFDVEVSTLEDFGMYPDLIKINVEGSEGAIVASIPRRRWDTMDAFVEVHNPENRDAILAAVAGDDVNIFAQKIGWQKVEAPDDMPAGSKDGYIFVSTKDTMPW